MKSLHYLGIAFLLTGHPLSAENQTSNATLPSWFPVKTLELAKGWEVTSPRKADSKRVSIGNLSKRKHIEVRYEEGDYPKAPKRLTSSPLPIEGSFTGRLNIPLGWDHRFDSRPNFYRRLEVVGPGVWLTSSLQNGRTGAKKDTVIVPADEAFQEGLTRGMLARLAGLTATEHGIRVYDNLVNIMTAQIKGNNSHSYAIGVSTRALQITATIDYSRYILTLQKGNRKVVVPLGTRRIIVNGSARDLADVSAEIGDVAYVQAEALDALL